MVKKRIDKLDGAFQDFDYEAAVSLDQIFDSISEPDTFSEYPATNPQEDSNTFEPDSEELYNSRIFETLEDIERLEATAVEVAQATIDNLYKGSFVQEYAKNFHLTESEVKERLRLELANQLNAWGMKCVNKRHFALPREIKHIIRMDFYGTVDKIKDKKKLEVFFNIRNPENTLYNSPADYDLKKSPAWMVFRQFRSFRLLEKQLPDILIDQGITPQDFPRLNTYEISHILYNKFIHQSKPGAEETERANLFLGAKNRFVKAFIRRNKAAFKDFMDLKGVDPRYTKTLIQHMENYGTTGNFDVIEENYTPEMLEPLKRRSLVPPKTQPGDPITPEQAYKIKASGLLGTILARDENGDPVTGPEMTVHHKTAVQDCGEKTNFAEVNLFKNLCLIIEPYHFFAHSLDRTGTVNGAEYYVSRIEIKKGITFYGGFNSLYQIEQDFENAHFNEFDKEALSNYQNKEKLYGEYWEYNDKKSRKDKKKEKQNQKKLRQARSEEDNVNENNSHNKKNKKLKTADPYYVNLREQKIKNDQRRKEEALIKRREQLRLKAEKRAALKSASEEQKQKKSNGIRIISAPKPKTADTAEPVQKPAAPAKKRRKEQLQTADYKQKLKLQNQEINLKPEQILAEIDLKMDVSTLVRNIAAVAQRNDNIKIDINQFKRLQNEENKAKEKTAAAAAEPAANRWQPVAVPQENSKPAANLKDKKQKPAAVNSQTADSTAGSNKNFSRQVSAKQKRLEELEEIKAKTIAKFQAQRTESSTELTPQEELKLQRTIQYMLRQKGFKR